MNKIESETFIANEKYNQEEIVGLLIWCLGNSMSNTQRIIDKFPNRKHLSEMNKKELTIENADQGLCWYCWSIGRYGN
jgi:hypothetical protein